MKQRHKIIYPDSSEEIIGHYGMFVHSSGGFGFYIECTQVGYIFISSTNVRKIIPLGDS